MASWKPPQHDDCLTKRAQATQATQPRGRGPHSHTNSELTELKKSKAAEKSQPLFAYSLGVGYSFPTIDVAIKPRHSCEQLIPILTRLKTTFEADFESRKYEEEGYQEPSEVLQLNATFSYLDRCAETGCHIGRIIRQSLIFNAGSIEQLRQLTSRICIQARVHFTGNASWYIDCDIYCGNIGTDPAGVLGFDFPLFPGNVASENDGSHGSPRFIESAKGDRKDDFSHLINLCKKWLLTCARGHKLCSSSLPNCSGKETGYRLPTRLLDVGSEDGKEDLKLCPTSSFPPSLQNVEYVTLSYCWGPPSSSHSITTEHNYQERLTRIPLKDLSKTIQDAVTVTRALNYKYIWIDALCIIQPTSDNQGDWESEAPQMGSYYSNSVFTIAATRSSDSAQGFISPLDGTRYAINSAIMTQGRTPQYLGRLFNRNVQKWDVAVLQSPLLRRGWVLQELILSRRILYWTKDGLFWSCIELLASEFTPERVPFELLPGISDPVRSVRRMLYTPYHDDNKDDFIFSPKLWLSVVSRYSSLELTFQKDILAALAGVGQILSTKFGDKVVCGLLEDSSLAHGLSWYRNQTIPKEAHNKRYRYLDSCFTSRLPSWCWASSAGPIEFLTDSIPMSCKISGILAQTHGTFFNESSKLQLSGKLSKAVDISTQLLDEGNGVQHNTFHFDQECSILHQTFYFFLLWRRSLLLGSSGSAISLILKPLVGSCIEFKRVGLAKFENSDDVDEIFKGHSETVIILC